MIIDGVEVLLDFEATSALYLSAKPCPHNRTHTIFIQPLAISSLSPIYWRLHSRFALKIQTILSGSIRANEQVFDREGKASGSGFDSLASYVGTLLSGP